MGQSHRRNHTASECYIRRFAGRDGKLRLHTNGRLEAQLRTPGSIAYRNKFWGSSQSTRRAVEQELSAKLEDGASLALDAVVESWPPNQGSPEYAAVLQFLALHLIRSPAWRDHVRTLRDKLISDQIPHWRTQGLPIPETRAAVASDVQLANTLLGQIPAVAAMFGSMHWTLLQFERPLLVTSDQPVVAVPVIAPHAHVAVAAVPQTGLLSTLEYRVALDPRNALVMCWLDEPCAADPVPGDYRMAASLNIATAGQADKQVFWPSDAEPPFVCPPEVGAVSDVVSLGLYPHYTIGAVRRSRRLHETRTIHEDIIEERVTDSGMTKTVSLTAREAA